MATIAILMYGVHLTNKEINDWEQKNCADFDPPLTQGCRAIVHGDMGVEAHTILGINESLEEAYAGEINEIGDKWKEDYSDWNTRVMKALANFGFSQNCNPRWLLAAICD
jgi:hypothetical protein